MRIAIVHSFYASAVPSGENLVVEAQVNALREAGHEVLLVPQYTDVRARRRTYPVEAAFSVATGRGPGPVAALRSFGPDIVHVHNLFPNFGTAWLGGWRGPVVATMHNFRPMCAAGTLFRDGRVCTRCPDGDRWASLRHACYRGSKVATAPLARRNRGGVTRDAVVRRADAMVVLSERARRVYESAGVDAARLRVVPNFVEELPADAPSASSDPSSLSHPSSLSDASNGRWLFVGRLTPEKGILELVRSWPAGEALDVVGEGPLLEEASAAAPEGISFLGPRPNPVLREAMPGYLGLVIASRWFEGLPTVYRRRR